MLVQAVTGDGGNIEGGKAGHHLLALADTTNTATAGSVLLPFLPSAIVFLPCCLGTC